MAPGDVERDKIAFLAAFEGRGVVEFVEDFEGVVEPAAAEVGLSEPVTGKLAERTVLAGIVGRRLQIRHGIVPGLVGNELRSAQIVGFHIVALHSLVEFVYFVEGLDRCGVVPVAQSRHCDVAVDAVVFVFYRIAVHIFPEDGGVAVEVEGELRVVEKGVLGDVGYEILLRGVAEAVHRLHLVAYAYVAVAEIVVRDLAEGVAAVAHSHILVPCALPVLNRVEQRCSEEEARTAGVRTFGEQAVVNRLRPVGLAQHEAGLGEQAGHVFRAFVLEFRQQLVAVGHHIFIVLQLEVAVQSVICGQVGKTLVVGLAEPAQSLAEAAVVVVYISQSEAGRARIGRRFEARNLLETFGGTALIADGEVAPGPLVKEFGTLPAAYVFDVDIRKQLACALVVASVEEQQGIFVTQPRNHRGIGVEQAVVVEKDVHALALHPYGAKQTPALDHRVLALERQFLEFLPCTLVHALFTERAGVVVELAGSRVGERPGGGLGEEPGGYGKRRRKQCGSEQI